MRRIRVSNKRAQLKININSKEFLIFVHLLCIACRSIEWLADEGHSSGVVPNQSRMEWIIHGNFNETSLRIISCDVDQQTSKLMRVERFQCVRTSIWMKSSQSFISQSDIDNYSFWMFRTLSMSDYQWNSMPWELPGSMLRHFSMLYSSLFLSFHPFWVPLTWAPSNTRHIHQELTIQKQQKITSSANKHWAFQAYFSPINF